MVFIPGAVSAQSYTATFTTFNDPSTSLGTVLTGISGNQISGFSLSGGSRNAWGFSYNGSSFYYFNDATVRLMDPLSYAYGTEDSFANGISGNNVIGSFREAALNSDFGYLYNGSSYTLLSPVSFSDPDFFWSDANGISGNNIVGNYAGWDGFFHGYLYNGSSYTMIDDPSAVSIGSQNNVGTFANGIDGNNIVGSYTDSNSVYHGFLYNGSTYTTLDDPLGVKGTWLSGISGKYIVGSYQDSNNIVNGFLYDGSTYTTLGTNGTYISGIDGTNIVGTMITGQPLNIGSAGNANYGSGNVPPGFVASFSAIAVPEPSTYALFGLGALALLFANRRGKRAAN